MPDRPTLYTPAELAAMTGLSVDNQRLWRSKGLSFGVQTAGGQWRFRSGDVLAVSVARALNSLDVELSVAAMIAKEALNYFVDVLRGENVTGVARTHRYGFVWRGEHSTIEATPLINNGYFDEQGNYCFLILSDIRRIAELSKFGGQFICLDAVADLIPASVVELIRKEQ